jgi:hypothetical protein
MATQPQKPEELEIDPQAMAKAIAAIGDAMNQLLRS